MVHSLLKADFTAGCSAWRPPTGVTSSLFICCCLRYLVGLHSRWWRRVTLNA